MKIEKNSNWQKKFSETIDQRQIGMPPAWVLNEIGSAPHSEQGRAILESSRNRKMAKTVISLLAKAREKAVVCSFLIADKDIEDAILQAAMRGVRVYVLLASETRLGREVGDGEFEKRVFEQHKEMLTRLGGQVLFRSASHFHAKVVIVDPDMKPAGMLLTANLTSEALERNEELGVILVPEEVVEITSYLKWAMWESAEHEFMDPKDRFKATRPLGKVPHPGNGKFIRATTAKTNSLRDESLRLIDKARKSIVVSSFGWDEDHEVVQRLCARAREGLDVKVLARVRPSSMPALLALANAGANVFGFGWLHAKAICADTGKALVMSANLQRYGLDEGYELGVVLSEGRAQELRDRLSVWTGAAKWKLESHPRLGVLSGSVRLWKGDQFLDVDIKSTTDMDLGTITASSADNIEVPRPEIPQQGGMPHLAHELRCTWMVEAPMLAGKSKEILQPAKGNDQSPASCSPPVYREPGGRVVVAVQSPDELKRARAIMAEANAKTIVVAERAK